MTRTTIGTLFPIPLLALLLAGGCCRHDGPAGATPAAPEANGTQAGDASGTSADTRTTTSADVPAVLGATIRLPPPGETQPRWLNATVTTGPDGWFMAGCVSQLVGVCRWNPRFPLDEAEQRAYAEHIAAIRAMPRCEPVGFAPDDDSFDLDLDGQARAGHIPHAWFTEGDRSGPPNDGSDPCMAEVYLAWWIYTTLAAHDHVNAVGAPAEPSPPCSESCCAPDDRTPDPSGAVECCFCAPR
jgi:hypothetical protein